jgi:hypothetical protein
VVLDGVPVNYIFVRAMSELAAAAEGRAHAKDAR